MSHPHRCHLPAVQISVMAETAFRATSEPMTWTHMTTRATRFRCAGCGGVWKSGVKICPNCYPLKARKDVR